MTIFLHQSPWLLSTEILNLESRKTTRRTCAQGSKIAVVGANGCGKSTLLSYLSGREKPKEGEIRLQLGFLNVQVGRGTRLPVHALYIF